MKVDGKAVTAEIAYPDTLVGTNSHTTMVNGLSVLGWGVGGIEAEAAMLGQPYSMVLPEVIGFRLGGKLKEGVTATDLVLTVTQMLRKRGVVGKFVEFFGPGLDNLTIEDRATIGNMAPEYGATCGFFPVDDDTIDYLTKTARKTDRVALVKAYAKAQGMYRTKTTPDPVFTDVMKLELGSVEPSLAGPKRPQDRVAAEGSEERFRGRDGQGIQQGKRADEALPGRGPQARYRPRRCGDRGDHLLHQHVESERHGGGRIARQEGGGERPDAEAVGEDLARAGLAGRRGVSGKVRPAEGARQDRLQSRRLRLHELHREFRPACRGDLRSRSTRTTSSRPRCSRATAISKAA